MKKIIRRLIWVLLILLIIGSSTFVFFTYTSSGLNTLVRFAAYYFKQPIEIQDLQGRLKDHAQIKEFNYRLDQINIKIKDARFAWTINSLPNHDISLKEFHADSVEITEEDTVIILHDVQGSALINKENITIHSLSFNYLDLTVLSDLQLKPLYPYTFNSRIKLNTLGKLQNAPEGILGISGDMNLIQWSGDFVGLGSISLEGSLKNLKQLDQVIKWRDLSSWPSGGKQEVLSKEGRITISGVLPQLKIDLNTKINRTPEDPWQFNGQIQGSLPWAWNLNLNFIQMLDKGSKREGLYTSFALDGELKSPYQAAFKLKIAPGHYQLPADSGLNSLVFQEGLVKATLSTKGLQGTGAMNLDPNKKFTVNFSLPKFNFAEGLTKKQSFSAQLVLALNSLDFLSSLIPELKNPKGSLNLSLNAKGDFDKPKIESKLILNKGSFELASAGLSLDSIEANLTSKKDRWDGTVALRSGNQPLLMKGKGLLFPKPTADISLEGTNVPIITSSEYQVNASPKLQIKYNKDLLQILGTVLIPSAKIKIQSFSNSIGLSNDVVFESNKKEKAPSSPIRTQIDVKIVTGDQVELSAKGLNASLSGTVNLKQSPQSSMTGTGELNVVKGEYKAYGQNLTIEQGELFFTGGTIDNPGINLRASKIINASSSTSSSNEVFDFNSNNIQNANLQGNITVGVEVTGRLINPEIKLFSTPAILSQADILSMIVLGRPASQANKSGAHLILAALSSMGGNGQGTQLINQLKQNLGVDFNVETNSNYNLLTNQVSDKTAFVVSKSISKRISVSYNVGLSQSDPNLVTLKYLLNKFFSIQISTSSSSSGVDVLYTSSKK